MAFDSPLEADRIDDLGFVSAFIRAPVIGTLMWVLGGSKAMEEDEKDQMMIDSENDGTSRHHNHRHSLNMKETNGKLKKTAPRLIGSDISEFAAEAEALSLEGCSLQEYSDLRKSRKMSWSDESGQDLCQYIGESTTPYEPPKLANASSANNAKPIIKSAMRRSSSVSEDVSQGNTKRYLPKGLGGDHSGLVMPTKPGDIAAGAPTHGPGGYHSPEWGWYINTTPPTPEMYHSHYASTRGKMPTSQPNTVFPASGPPAFSAQKTAGMQHWPSVPL
jgi:hypothetical protein